MVKPQTATPVLPSYDMRNVRLARELSTTSGESHSTQIPDHRILPNARLTHKLSTKPGEPHGTQVLGP